MSELENQPEVMIDPEDGAQLLDRIVFVEDQIRAIEQHSPAEGLAEIKDARVTLESQFEDLAKATQDIEAELPGFSFDRLLPRGPGEQDGAQQNETDLESDVDSTGKKYGIDVEGFSEDELGVGLKKATELSRVLAAAKANDSDQTPDHSTLIATIEDYKLAAGTRIESIAVQKISLETVLVGFSFTEQSPATYFAMNESDESDETELFVSSASFDKLVSASALSNEIVAVADGDKESDLSLSFELDQETKARLTIYTERVNEEIGRRLEAIEALAGRIPEFNLLKYSNEELDKIWQAKASSSSSARVKKEPDIDPAFDSAQLSTEGLLSRIDAVDQLIGMHNGRLQKGSRIDLYPESLFEYRHVLNQRLKEGAEYAKAVEAGAKREIFARRLPDIQIPDAYREEWESSGELVRNNARRAVDAMANLINNDLGPGSLATESREIVSSADFGLLEVVNDDRSSELAIVYLGDRLGFYGDDVDIKSIGGNRMSEIQLNDSSGGYVIVDILEESYPGTVRDAIELYPERFDLDGSHSVVFPPNNTAAGSYVDRTSIMRLGGDREVESIAVEVLFDPGMHQVIPVIPLSKLLPAS